MCKGGFSHPKLELLESDAQLLHVLVGRTGAYKDVVFAGLYAHAVGLGIPELETVLVKFECNAGGLAGLYVDALEGTETLQRPVGILQVADI